MNERTRRRRTAGRLIAVMANAILVLALARPAAAGPGDLDSTFGSGGKVVTDFGDVSVANTVAEQDDGKIVVAGRVGPGDSGDFGVARYNGNGTLDAGFGSGGTVVTPFTGGADMVRSLAIQPDGKIVVAGLAGSEGTGDFALARYNPDGRLDEGFGSGGKVTTDLSGGLGDGIRAMAILADGKILAVGAAASNVGFARYMPDGSLDPGFGSGGKQIVRFGHSVHAFSLALLGDGRFLIAGNAFGSPTLSDFMLARFNADGSLDTNFGTDGSVTTDFGGLHDIAFGMAVQRDGKIVAAGLANSFDGVGLSGDVQFAIARYSSNGTLDRTFGSGGRVWINPSPLADGLRAVGVQRDGRIVVGGFVGEVYAVQSFMDPVIGDFAAARLNADGSVDPTFGIGGLVTTDFAAGGDGVRAAVLRGNGKLLAVGGATTNRLNFALAQYTTKKGR